LDSGVFLISPQGSIDEQIDAMVLEIRAKLREMMIEKKKTGFRTFFFPSQVVSSLFLIHLFRLHP
jgi:hypothetical protein